jgi:hypothetical protein
MDGGLVPESVPVAVTKLMRDIAARYPCASYSEHRDAPKAPWLNELVCALPNTSRITIVPDHDPLDLYLGANTWIELFPGRHEPPAKVLNDITAIIEAVVDGRFEETLWRIGRRVTRSAGFVREQDGSVRRISRGAEFPVFVSPARKSNVRYEPYG